MNQKRPSILLLTGKNKDGKKEDLFLAKHLKKYFEIIVGNMDKAELLAEKTDLILIRNIWPTSRNLGEDRRILSNLIKKGKRLYNPGLGEEDLIGKEYLVYLFKKGFPVIPTIDEKEDLDLLGEASHYFVKPKHGGGREGCRKVSKKDILRVDFSKNVAQPFLDFKYELSFYFIDNELVYVLYAPNKNKRWDLKPIKIGKKERDFAQKFVNWNNLSYGIQRIDACRTRDGNLLLMEIEDWCPYLSLLDINEKLRNKFLKGLTSSLKIILYH